jgi:Arc/MetJ family transcription regulator
MRTTLDIDDDVLQAAKEIAALRKKTAGQIISDLARKALTEPSREEAGEYRGGFRLLPRTGQILTPKLIEQFLDEDR